MDEFAIRRAINDARLTTRNAGLSTAEFNFVTLCPLLTANEKLLWLHIATKTVNHRAFCCRLSEQDIVQLIGNQPDAFFKAVQNLKKHGFLDVYEQPELGVFYALLLPEEGINALLDAPKFCACQLSSHTHK